MTRRIGRMDRDSYLENQILRMMSLEEINDTLAHLTYDGERPLERIHTYYDDVYANYGQQISVDYKKGDIIMYHLNLDDDFTAYEEWNLRG